MYIKRHLETTIEKLNSCFKVLLVTGPRQVGKTTLLRRLAAVDRTYVTMDDISVRSLAMTEPALFLQRYKPPLLIDEIQLAPKLLPYLKMYVDEQGQNGDFWLTGSQAFELSFRTEGIVWVPCDRCLDEMEQPVTSSDKLMVKFGHEYAEEGDNLIVIPEEEGEINVAWFMYEFIALAIPMKHVHAPGKCNKAVTSKLNKHLRTSGDDDAEESFGAGEDIVVEDEAEEQIDPRWNELKKILDNN